jgi:hypothetical protein
MLIKSLQSWLLALIFNHVFHENYALVKISTRIFHIYAHHRITHWSQMNTSFQISYIYIYISGWNLRSDINTELIKTWNDFNYVHFIVFTKTLKWNKRLGVRFLIYYFVWQPQVQGTFLDTFTKVQEWLLALPCLRVSVCPTVSNCLPIRPHGTTLFMKTDIWAFYKNLQRKFKFHENMTRITGALRESLRTFMTISHWILLRMRNVSDKGCWENHAQ